jgi:hypothetical protein
VRKKTNSQAIVYDVEYKIKNLKNFFNRFFWLLNVMSEWYINNIIRPIDKAEA